MREGSTGPAEACGLTLEHIAYPADDLLAERAEHIRARRELPADYGEALS
jgi:tRNA pseudouridine38-40 synthase